MPISDRAERGAGNDTMPPIERRRHAAQQRVGPDVDEVGRGLVGGGEEHRDGGEEAGDRPHARSTPSSG